MRARKLCMVLSLALLLTGCGQASSKSTSKKTSKETTSVAKEDGKLSGVIKTEELRIENGDNTIYGKLYTPKEEGTYPAIILSHGYNGSNSDWIKECTYYAQNGYVAYAFDFCGGSANAKSTGASTDMTIFTEKNDLLAVYEKIAGLDCVDSDKVFLMGGSQGGLVTTLATEELQDKVAGMILYFPAFCIADDWQKKYTSLDQVEETIDFWGLTLGKGFVEAIFDFNVFENIGTYEGDVLIMHGDKDAIVPLSYSEEAVKLYKNAELITMPGEGHGFTPTGAKTAMDKTLNFMEEHR